MAVKFTRNFSEANLVVAEGHAYADECLAMVILSKVTIVDLLVFLDRECDEGDFFYQISKSRYVNYSKYDYYNTKVRKNGVKYSTCGIVWRIYGRKYISKFDNVDADKIEEIWEKIDVNFIQQIDRISNLQFLGDNEICHGKSFSEFIFNLNYAYPFEERIKAYEEAICLCEKRLKEEVGKAVKAIG